MVFEIKILTRQKKEWKETYVENIFFIKQRLNKLQIVLEKGKISRQ